VNAALRWLEPLSRSIPDINTMGWQHLRCFADDLERLAGPAPHPSDAHAWASWVLSVRRDLATRDHHAPAGSNAQVWQTLAQFCAGFLDLDLRDCLGPGHGAMVLADAIPATAEYWRKSLCRGDLMAIAATERHGGSRIQEITARAQRHRRAGWVVTGEKCWVARLNEASGFVVFFRDPDAQITAAVIRADEPGLERDIAEGAGLGGCSWGVLRLHHVWVDPSTDLLGAPGEGLDVFRRHFAGFRPLVAATALGTAAGIHTLVTGTLAARFTMQIVPRIRDNALITLGRTHGELTAALLSALSASRMAAAGDRHAAFAAQSAKACGVDTAVRTVAELAPLIGAAGFQRAHPIAKARADLTGLLYADGIHDSLYRANGLRLIENVSPDPPPTVVVGHGPQAFGSQSRALT
jgi:alkylation response protein AidB-like acyl-CoA dehydrogenase